MRTTPLILCVWLAACSGAPDESELDLPDFGTSHVLFGTAARGRSITPSSLQVRPATELSSVRPELIGGTEVDMVVAGLQADDLPQGLSPTELTFVSDRAANARDLPELYQPHVLQKPSLPEVPTPLAPATAEGLARDVREERQDRLQALLDGVAVSAPCTELTAPIVVTTPRTAADIIRVMHTLSTGETVLGLSITSTVVVAVLPSTGGEPAVVSLPMSQPILQPGEVSDMRWMSAREVMVQGRLLPEAFTFDISGGFSSSGVHIFWDPRRQRYVEDTPATADAAPRSLHGMAKLDLDGTPSQCGFGSGLGSDRPAIIWCRTETSTAWSLQLQRPRAIGITAIYPQASGAHFATDLAGTIYEYAGGGRWPPILESSLNADCDPLCAAFTTSVGLTQGGSVAVVAGAKAQLLLLDSDGSRTTTRRPQALDPALFADEKPEARDPLTFSAVTESPDGALWLADSSPTLLRLNPERTEVQRVCLPKEMTNVPIASLEAHPDGRLLLGMSPALLGTGTWR